MPKKSLVLDTNVVVSALLKQSGAERYVLDLVLASELELCISSAIFEEYGEVLKRTKFGFGPSEIAGLLRLMASRARHYQPRRRVSAAKDVADNKFLECAEEAEADYLVTGNKRHFPRRWRKTSVVNARELIEIIIPDLK